MFVGVYFVLVAASSFQLTNSAVAKTSTDDNTKIVFPGPTVQNKFGEEKKPHPCEGLNYCTIKPDDYPQEHFNKMFKGKYKEPIFQPTLVQAEVGDRWGEDDSDEEMETNSTLDCRSKVTFEPVYQIRDPDMKTEWLTVAQAPAENFVQSMRIETCINRDATCFKKFQAPVEMFSFCKQKYNVWVLLVDDGKGGTKPAQEPIFQPTLVQAEVGDRWGEDDSDEEMETNSTLDCRSKVTFEPVYQIRDPDMKTEWLTVAQAPAENFVQSMRIETCINRDATCFKKFQAPVEMFSFCKQKYNVWVLLVDDGKGGTKPAQVELPACCVCQYKLKYLP